MTAERIRQEANKKLLNKILATKINKTINRKTKEQDELTNTTKEIGYDTLGSFKNLKDNLGAVAMNKLFDYESMYSTIKNDQQEPQPLFDFSQLKGSKEHEESIKRTKSKERNLQKRFQQYAAEIHEKKELVNSFRVHKFDLNNEICRLHDNVTPMINNHINQNSADK